jgi:endonuclease/exonuclease/phosphatase family metal-dependent hydrolase
VRIATFNVFSGRSPADGQLDPARFVDAIAGLDADVIGLQEVDEGQPRTDGVSLTSLAVEATGATDHRFVPAMLGTPGKAWSAATDVDVDVDDGPAYGIALLSRYPVLTWRVVRLPGAPMRVPYRFPGQRLEWVRDEPRVAVLALIDSPNGEMWVANTHLSFLPLWNRVQLRLLLRSVRQLPEPAVLMGDLNMRRRSAERLTGMTPLATGQTFPVDGPDRQLDHLLVRGQLSARSGGPVRLQVSDHLALVAEIT